MSPLAIAVVAGLVVAHASVSTWLQHRPVTPPMVFLLAGMLLGTGGLGLVGSVEREVLDPLAEITLVLVLFTDAARLDLGRLRGHTGVPVRLLAIGLPLTVVAGAAAAALVLDGLSGWSLLVLGVALAPTDAALGQAVVSDDRVPALVRQSLNIESGLNDGLALPALTVAMAAAAGSSAGGLPAVGFVAQQVGVAVVVAVVVGRLGAVVLDRRSRVGGMRPAAQQLATLAVGVGAWGLAQALGGNGFVAAFVAGLTFGAMLPQRCDSVADFTEEEGQLLTLLTFLLVGASLAWPALSAATPHTVAYALLSLTVVRMLPVAVALLGTGMRPVTTGFVGWFGPRGLASLVFGLLVVQHGDVPGAQQVLDVVVLTVLLSVLLHGVTASPWAVRYARRVAAMSPRTAERRTFPDLVPRIRYRDVSDTRPR